MPGQVGNYWWGQLNVPLSYHAPSKRRQKEQSTKHNKQKEAYVTNEQYAEPLEQKNANIVSGRRTYSEATKFGIKILVIYDSHLNRIKNRLTGGKHILIFFERLYLRDRIIIWYQSLTKIILMLFCYILALMMYILSNERYNKYWKSHWGYY